MADPFDDIDGIVKANETEVSIAQSALFNKDKGPEVVKPEEEGEEAYLERFPRRIRTKASSDLKNRMELEKAIHSSMVELHNVREQLYLVRFDDVRSTEEVKRDCQNYSAEIERLESKVTKLREKMLESYTKSLNLEQVGISGAALITTTVHHKNSMVKTQGGSTEGRLYSEGNLAPRFGRLMSRHDLDGSAPPPSSSSANPEEGDLLRKYSFGLLGVKSPATHNRAPSPMDNFFGQGNSLAFEKKKLSPDEVADVRAALYNLKQKKELTPKEEQLVETLTAKLRDA